MEITSNDRTGMRYANTASDNTGKIMSANEHAALKEKGIDVNVYCIICHEELTSVHYAGSKNEAYYRCPTNHKKEYCRKIEDLGKIPSVTAETYAWIITASLNEPPERPGPGPHGPKPTVPPANPGVDVFPNGQNWPEGIDIPGGEDFPGHETFLNVQSPNGTEDSNNPNGPTGPEYVGCEDLKQMFYSQDNLAFDPLRKIPSTDKVAGDIFMPLSANEQMMRALHNLPSPLRAFEGGRFVLEAKVARIQNKLKKRIVDFQVTSLINGKSYKIYVNCIFKKKSYLKKVFKSTNTPNYEDFIDDPNHMYIPVASVFIWASFDVEQPRTENGYIRFKATIYNSKQIFVTLPFSECPDRSKG